MIDVLIWNDPVKSPYAYPGKQGKGAGNDRMIVMRVKNKGNRIVKYLTASSFTDK